MLLGNSRYLKRVYLLKSQTVCLQAFWHQQSLLRCLHYFMYGQSWRKKCKSFRCFSQYWHLNFYLCIYLFSHLFIWNANIKYLLLSSYYYIFCYNKCFTFPTHESFVFSKPYEYQVCMDCISKVPGKHIGKRFQWSFH